MVNPIMLASGDDITMDMACPSVYPDLRHVYLSLLYLLIRNQATWESNVEAVSSHQCTG
jgi:hypothetical protein